MCVFAWVCTVCRLMGKRNPFWASVYRRGETLLRIWDPSKHQGRSAAGAREGTETARFKCLLLVSALSALIFFFSFFPTLSFHVQFPEKKQNYLVSSVFFFLPHLWMSASLPHPLAISILHWRESCSIKDILVSCVDIPQPDSLSGFIHKCLASEMRTLRISEGCSWYRTGAGEQLLSV